MQLVNTALFIYSFVLLLAIYIYNSHSKYALTSDKLFKSLVRVTLLLLVADLLARFDGLGHWFYPYFSHTGNFISYGISHFIPALWFMFIHYRLFTDGEALKKLYRIFGVITLINWILLVITQFTGLYYVIDSQNMYQRGPFFYYTHVVNGLMIIASLVLLIYKRDRIEKNNMVAYVLFSLIPASGLVVQILLPGVAYIPNSIGLALVIMFIFVQNNRVRYDHLTGIFNRRQMDFYLEDKLIAAKKGKAFSAILIDLDDFKTINDTKGHTMGDEALKRAAKLLTESIGKQELLARYGGDEFLIVTTKHNQDDLRQLISQIYQKFEVFNDRCKRFRIEISHGLYTYTPDLEITKEAFIDLVDQRMYGNKRKKKQNHDV